MTVDSSAIVAITFREPGHRALITKLAYLQYGKGRHKAQLNFGDCLSYAVARLAGEPLLFMGNDYSQTDLDIA